MTYEQLLIENISTRDKKIEELEKKCDAYMTYYVYAKRWFDKHDPNGYVSPSQDKCKATLQAHNLRQQANGLQHILSFAFSMNSPASEWVDVIYLSDIENTIEQLNKQADELEKKKKKMSLFKRAYTANVYDKVGNVCGSVYLTASMLTHFQKVYDCLVAQAKESGEFYIADVRRIQ